MRIISRLDPALASLALTTAAPAETSSPASCVIDLAEPRQVIDHFGAGDARPFQKIGVFESRRVLGIVTARRVARVTHCDLANAPAWQWWLAVNKGDCK